MRKNDIKHILEVINSYTTEFKNIPSIDRTLSNTYIQKLEDIQEWLALTTWSTEQIGIDKINLVNATLRNLGRIKKALPYSKLIH